MSMAPTNNTPVVVTAAIQFLLWRDRKNAAEADRTIPAVDPVNPLAEAEEGQGKDIGPSRVKFIDHESRYEP
jgi:hypothetical protein